jgi:hypothetical protein
MSEKKERIEEEEEKYRLATVLIHTGKRDLCRGKRDLNIALPQFSFVFFISASRRNAISLTCNLAWAHRDWGWGGLWGVGGALRTRERLAVEAQGGGGGRAGERVLQGGVELG